MLEQPSVAEPVRHSLWEVDELEAMNEVLGGELQMEVDLLQRRVKAQELEVEAEAAERRRAAEVGEVQERWELGEDAVESWNWGMKRLKANEGGRKEGQEETGAGGEGEAVGRAEVADSELAGAVVAEDEGELASPGLEQVV